MILTQRQAEGLDLTIQRYRNKEKYTVIAGYAGTGKSTLIKFIINALLNEDVKKEDVVFCSYTGKATLVLSQKGNENTMTLHKLLYKSKPLPDGTFVRIPKTELEYRLIVIDECSMVPKKMVDLLLSHSGIYCIFCGDNQQLPPVDKDADNHLLDHPHIFLNEIQRQAAESDIIQLSLAIREGKPIKTFKGNDTIVINKNEMNTGMMTWADQILCATNKTRVSLNAQMRQILGRGKEPEPGDRLICLRNYDDYYSEDGNMLVNGTTGIIQNCYKSFISIPQYTRKHGEGQIIDTLEGEFIDDLGDSYGGLIMDYSEITTGERCMGPKTIYMLSKTKKYQHLVPMEFTYGYAVTVWKAQGSEWDKVLVLEEGHPWDREEHKRYLYTAITRASQKVVLVLKG